MLTRLTRSRTWNTKSRASARKGRVSRTKSPPFRVPRELSFEGLRIGRRSRSRPWKTATWQRDGDIYSHRWTWSQEMFKRLTSLDAEKAGSKTFTSGGTKYLSGARPSTSPRREVLRENNIVPTSCTKRGCLETQMTESELNTIDLSSDEGRSYPLTIFIHYLRIRYQSYLSWHDSQNVWSSANFDGPYNRLQ